MQNRSEEQQDFDAVVSLSCAGYTLGEAAWEMIGCSIGFAVYLYVRLRLLVCPFDPDWNSVDLSMKSDNPGWGHPLAPLLWRTAIENVGEAQEGRISNG